MLIAGPNLTIDRAAALSQLRPGEVLRFERVVVTPGGKGLNVARAALALGHPALLVALVPGHTGRAAAALIAEEGIELSGVPSAGELRSTMIVEERGGRTTVLNEPGPRVDERRWADYENAVRGRLTPRSVLVCSGSVPPGAPAEGFGRLTEIAHAAGARAVVDAAGSTLLRALDSAPDLVTPNLAEAEGSLGLGGASVDDPTRAGAGGGRGAAAPGRARRGRDGGRRGRGGGERRRGGVDRGAARGRGAQPDRGGRRVPRRLGGRVGVRVRPGRRGADGGRGGRGERRAPDGGGARPGAGSGVGGVALGRGG